MAGGSVTTVEVGGGSVVAGSDVEDVGGSVVGGASVVGGVVVADGGAGAVVAGAAVPVFRGAVVTTDGWVVTVPPPPVVDVDATVEEVEDVEEVEAFEVVVGPGAIVVVALTVVDGDWVATRCCGDESLPVATSNRRAAKAIDARA